MIIYLKKLSNFKNVENKLIVCEIITNHII